jgi:hypothetical protein
MLSTVFHGIVGYCSPSVTRLGAAFVQPSFLSVN